MPDDIIAILTIGSIVVAFIMTAWAIRRRPGSERTSSSRPAPAAKGGFGGVQALGALLILGAVARVVLFTGPAVWPMAISMFGFGLVTVTISTAAHLLLAEALAIRGVLLRMAPADVPGPADQAPESAEERLPGGSPRRQASERSPSATPSPVVPPETHSERRARLHREAGFRG